MSIETKQKQLEEAGYNKEWFETKYRKENQSINWIIKELKTNGHGCSKDTMKKLLNNYGIQQKTKEEIEQSRQKRIKETVNKNYETQLYGTSQVTQDVILEAYQKGMTVSEIEREYGVPIISTSAILKRNNIDTKRSKTVVELMERLKQYGLQKTDIETMYLNVDNTFEQFRTWLSNQIEYDLTATTTRRLINKLGLKKDKETIRAQQGSKSKSVLTRNVEKLQTAGFNNLQELADYYTGNTITKHGLVSMLNENLGENFFTIRWLERHMDPLVPEDKKKFTGSSRGEKEMIQYIESIVGDYLTVKVNDRTIIPPSELDVYIPELHLAVEYNGEFWHSNYLIHSNNEMTAEEYHKQKEAECRNVGVQLLYVWERDWETNKEEIKAALKRNLENPNVVEPLLKQYESFHDRIDKTVTDERKTFNRTKAPDGTIDAKILDEYQKCGNLSEVCRRLHYSRPFVRESLKRSGVVTKQFTYNDVLVGMGEHNVTRDDVYNYYIIENHTRQETIEYLRKNCMIENNFGFDLFDKLMSVLEIKKLSSE